jgi:DNA-binding SARP family transcriptional activator/TolB-like protein/cytochrome c-type biogenesis protein CcmH/NrfG
MSRLNTVSLRLLGSFAIEANVGRPIALSVRAKKARGLLAYLAMQPDYRSRREELATLFWGDTIDVLARHSLRQCLNSLRQDLSAASEIIVVDRESVGLNAQLLSVDARAFMSLVRAGGAAEFAEAAELWRGSFLPDLVLDLDEFDLWREREAHRLAAGAADVFETLCRNADVRGDGERALAAAERLVALEPTREDRQRTALKLMARYKGRGAALSHAKLLTDLLRDELGVAPEAATRALIEAIKRGEFERKDALSPEPERLGAAEARGASDAEKASPPASETTPSEVPAAIVPLVEPASEQTAHMRGPFWRRGLPAGAPAVGALIACITIAVVGIATWPRLSQLSVPQQNRSVAILPFVTDSPTPSGDSAFARLLTHDLIGYLSRYGDLRVLSGPASDAYRNADPAGTVLGDLGVQYALVGHVQGDAKALKMDIQLVDAATRTNVWSDNLERERSDPAVAADEAARGIARMLAYQIDHLAALRLRGKPNAQLTVGELVGRGYLAMDRGMTKENLSAATNAFTEALRRNPHYVPAVLAAARVQIVAVSNFIDLAPRADLNASERVLNESLSRFPNSISALYSLALLQKHRRQYEASMRSLQRCLEINPSFLPAQGQMAHILTRSGQPQKGLELIQKTIRSATANDPSIGYWYLFAAEAELDLGHDRAALDWALRANTFMPGSPLVQAWLASIYSTAGDKSNAAKYAAALRKMAPDRTRVFVTNMSAKSGGAVGRPRPPIFDGLRLALGE